MTDFSKVNIHCSSIGAIMSSGKRKTFQEQWQCAVDKLNGYQSKYDAIEESKRESKSAGNNSSEAADLYKRLMEITGNISKEFLTATNEDLINFGVVITKEDVEGIKRIDPISKEGLKIQDKLIRKEHEPKEGSMAFFNKYGVSTYAEIPKKQD